MKDIEAYHLDQHCNHLLQEYRDSQPLFKRLREVALRLLNQQIEQMGLSVISVGGRVKAEDSLAGKLERKGHKYANLLDITDILGTRIVVFYREDVDKIAAMAENIFEIDWENSVDKRKMLDLDRFGYSSLHYICRIPKSLYTDPDFPELNDIRFELQMCTALQHAWSTLHHDTGYKSGIEVPRELLRSLMALAGMLEIADGEFSRIRTNINDYRHQMEALVSDGKLDEVPFNSDTYSQYLRIGPFDKLNKRIAAINQAEISEVSVLSYRPIFSNFGIKTLGDLDQWIKHNSEDAYLLARNQLGSTDIDIIASNVAVENLCIAHLLHKGASVDELTQLFDMLDTPSKYNRERAIDTQNEARKLGIKKE
jgi:putative GTP pyrophosphokinase